MSCDERKINFPIFSLSDMVDLTISIHHFAIVFEQLSIAFNSILSFQHNRVVFQQLCKMFQILFFIEKKNSKLSETYAQFFFKSDEKICWVYRDSQIDHISKTKNRKINFSFVSKHNAS